MSAIHTGKCARFKNGCAAKEPRNSSCGRKKGNPVTSCIAAAALLIAFCAARAGAAPQPARSADEFVDGIGINTHLHYANLPYFTKWNDWVKTRLLELGVRHIRDYYNPNIVDRHLELQRAGLRMNTLVYDQDKVPLSEAIAGVKKILPFVESIEGVNEPDIAFGANWVANTRAQQAALYKAVKADPAIRHIPVLVSAMAHTLGSPSKLGDLSVYLDYGAMHSYAGGQPPTRGGYGGSLDQVIAEERLVCGDKPIIVTENGYHQKLDLLDHPGVSEEAAAKYMPRMHLVNFSKGIVRRFTYQLLDDLPDPEFVNHENHFGIVRVDGTPKPAYNALRNLILLLNDPGPAFVTGSLAYTIEGDTALVRSVLLQKRGGDFYLALWVETSSFDTKSQKDINVPARRLTVQIDQPITQATAYSPNVSVAPVGTWNSPTRIQVDVSDNVLFLHIIPVGTALRSPAPSQSRGGTLPYRMVLISGEHPFYLPLPSGVSALPSDSRGRRLQPQSAGTYFLPARQ